jgi:hypothetical protein
MSVAGAPEAGFRIPGRLGVKAGEAGRAQHRLFIVVARRPHSHGSGGPGCVFSGQGRGKGGIVTAASNPMKSYEIAYYCLGQENW